MAALELLAFPWRKKSRAYSPTALLEDLEPQIETFDDDEDDE
jgi:hypothetical protein